jgi:heterodisulfide reductase subunit A-like polyferredoxin
MNSLNHTRSGISSQCKCRRMMSEMHYVGVAEQVWQRHGGLSVFSCAGTSDRQPEDRYSSRQVCRLKPKRARVQRLP